MILTPLLAFAALQTPPLFKDRTAVLGLTIAGEGACWIDIDNDGWTDLAAGGGVWKNNKATTFTKVADIPKVVAADFDNDGFTDLFSIPLLKLYRNLRGKSFEEVKLPELPKAIARGACWGDWNNDGFADLYVGGYEDGFPGKNTPSFVLMNRSGKTFEVGLTDERYRARGITACDFDNDGDLDIYCSNYRLQPNVLWLNDGKGNFKDEAAERGVVAASEGFSGGHSIGSAWGDFDNDGLIDLFAGNFAHVDNRGDQPKSRFLRNLGPSDRFKFEDKGTSGVFYQESYASPAAGDYDNDGQLDLFFTTVYATASFGKKNNSVLFRGSPGFSFADATALAGLAGLGATYQAAWGDYDNDGDLDLVTDGKLFQNTGAKGRWLEVRVIGDGKKVNRSAIGAQVRVKLPGRTLTRQVEAGTGEGNANDLVLHFGLGSHTGPVKVEVAWPGGKKTVHQVVANKRVEVKL